MQITLNQAEIEAAVRKAINEKVTINEEVAIVLENGPDGFTATADLDTEEERAAKPVKTRTPRGPNKPKGPDLVQTPLFDKDDKVNQTTPSETAQDAQQEPAANTATVETTEAAASTQAAGAAQSEQSGEADAAAEGKPADDETIPDKPKSLFAGLAKPRN